MSNREREFSEDDHQIQEVVARFKQMLKEGKSAYFDTYEYELIIEHFMNEDQMDLAREAIRRAEEIYADCFEIQLKKAQLLSYVEQGEYALELIEQLEKEHSEYPELLSIKASILIQLKRIEEAIQVYEHLCATAGGDALLSLEIGSYLHHLNQYDRAIPFLESAYDYINDLSIVYDLGYCYSQTKNWEKGIAFYLEYIEEDPLNAAVWYNLGINYNQIGESKKAIGAYDYAIALQEDLDQAFFNKGNVLANTNHHKKAIESYLEYLELQPNSEEAHLYLGDCYLALYQHDEAVRYYTKAYDLNPSNMDALHHVAISLLGGEHFEKALAIMRVVIKQEPKNAPYQVTLGNVNFGCGNFTQAEKAYERAIAIDKHCIMAWGALSDISSVMNDFPSALSILEEGLKKNPKDTYLNMKRILLYVEKQDKEQTMNLFREALSQDTKHELKDWLYTSLEEYPDNQLAKILMEILRK